MVKFNQFSISLPVAQETVVNLVVEHSRLNENSGIVDDAVFIEVMQGTVEPSFTISLTLDSGECSYCLSDKLSYNVSVCEMLLIDR